MYLFVIAMDAAEGKGVVDLVLSNTVHQDHDARAAAALPQTHAHSLKQLFHRQWRGDCGSLLAEAQP